MKDFIFIQIMQEYYRISPSLKGANFLWSKFGHWNRFYPMSELPTAESVHA